MADSIPSFNDLLNDIDLTDLRQAGVGLAITSLAASGLRLEEKLPPLSNSLVATLGTGLLQQILDIANPNGHELGCLPMAMSSISKYLRAGEIVEKDIIPIALDPDMDWQKALCIPFRLRRVGRYAEMGNSCSSLALLSGLSAIISR